MAKLEYTAGLQFVVSTPTQTPDKNDRRRIRGHATRSRASCSQRKRIQLRSWINLNEDLSGKALLKTPSTSPLPKPIGSVFCGLQLPAGFEPHMIQDLVKMISLNLYIGYPYEICLNVHPVDRGWFPYMISDICCLHSMMFSLRAFIEKGTQSYLASYHYAQTLRILQARIDDFDRTAAISDATIMVLMTLITIAEITGDFEAMGIHVNGLAKIVSLRGGVRSLDTFTNLQVKVCRADLAYALRSGNRPIFFEEGMSWDCFIADKGLVRCSHQPHNTYFQKFVTTTLDKMLANALRDLHAFSCISNIAYQTTRKLAPELYNEMIISIMYRLIHLSFDGDLLQETIRLGLLVFSSTIFMRRYFLEEPHERLLSLYTDTLRKLFAFTIPVLPVPVMLWLAVLYHIITDKGASPEDYRGFWLEKAILLAGTETWPQACNILKSVAWVDFIHDVPGKRAFDAAMSRVHSSSKDCGPSEPISNSIS